MRLNKRLIFVFFLLTFLIGGALPFSILYAQDNAIILTIQIPEYMQDTFNDELFGEFEAQNPGVKVVRVFEDNNSYFGSAAYDLQIALESAQTWASAADVLMVNSWNMAPEVTRAGYILNLAPLTTGDQSLNEADFFPAIWESFQWDQGVWALPVSANLQFVVYDPAAFDEAGLTYPTTDWTFTEYANAIRALTKTNQSGEVIQPGILTWGGSRSFLRALVGHLLYDPNGLSPDPLLTTPDLEAFLTEWNTLVQEGLMGNSFSGDSQDVPLRIEGSWALTSFPGGDEVTMQAVLLPGNIAGMDVQAFAVSGGTQYPEQAYALAKFMTSNPLVINRLFGDVPARQSMVDVEVEDNTFFMPERSPEVQALIDEGITHAIPVSELRYYDYLEVAISNMHPDAEGGPLDAAAALQKAQTDASENLVAAAERAASEVVYVATAVPTPVLAAGETTLRFNLTSYSSPLPNREEWEALVEEFVASDPTIGQLVFDTGGGGPTDELMSNYDCFMQPYNMVPGNNELNRLLNFDPFIDADASFDESDFVGNLLQEGSRDNRLYAYPISIRPQALWYNIDEFTEANIASPEAGWTIDAFNDALRTLKVDPDDMPPFSPRDYGGTYLFVLMATYGGLPIDPRTDPPTINLADPASVNAMRQVLDLAKEGYIDYQELGAFGGGGGGFNNTVPLYNETLSEYSFEYRFNEEGETFAPYRLANYPTGSQYNGLSYTADMAYISAQSQNPEACYNWIKMIGMHPELFAAMPARKSLLTDPIIAAEQGEDAAAFYNVFNILLSDPNTIAFQTQSLAGTSPGSYITPTWIYRAFDRYVLEGADLEAELTIAAQNIEAYQGCIVGIPEMDMGSLASQTQEEQMAYFRQFTDCAILIDPSVQPLFAYYYQDEE